MDIKTTRFGVLTVESEDLIQFPAGLLGLEDCLSWVLLADAHNESLGWLQNTKRPDLALAVVSPRRFVPDFQLRVSRSEIAPLSLMEIRQAQVLVIVNKHEGEITLNMKAPLVINPEKRLGRQVVANGDQPLQYRLPAPVLLRKSA